MFKRTKESGTETPEEDTLPLQAGGSRLIERTAQSEPEPVSHRQLTPSYEVRKPAVRTLQTHAPSFGSSSGQTTPANLHVGRGLKLEGKIQSCDTLVIEGDVTATIESGTLTISETGEVRGEATVETAEINGKFDGTLIVKKCLTVNATGRITGIIRYGELKVEQGGKISGEVEAVEGTAVTAPSLRTGDAAASA
ncbi:MAG: polymer-forming cytoskeletal protein [Parvibaculum sp.]|nr:polymer-forming cytoskeletal protein [Parvibaculum sp.]